MPRCAQCAIHGLLHATPQDTACPLRAMPDAEQLTPQPPPFLWKAIAWTLWLASASRLNRLFRMLHGVGTCFMINPPKCCFHEVMINCLFHLYCHMRMTISRSSANRRYNEQHHFIHAHVCLCHSDACSRSNSIPCDCTCL